MKPKKRILFAKLGHFSHTNDSVADQLAKNFPDHDLIVADVKDYAKRDRLGSAYNLLSEAATFGPSVLRNRADLHAFFFRTPFMFRRLNHMLSEEFAPLARDIDVVVQTQGVFNARLAGVPLLVYTDYTFLNNLDDGHPYDRRLFRSERFLRYEADLYRSADAVAVAGSHVERTLIERYRCDPSRVRTVHIGSNVKIVPVDTNPRRYAARRVLFVGVDWERKGGPTLVEAFQEAAKDYPDARLTILGSTPSIADPRIDVIGAVDRSSVPAFYENASIFCMPSLIEPLGIAPIEASLYRLPVIGTRISGLLETVTDGETGLLVPPSDPTALAAALRRLFANPLEARRMGIAGYARNRLRFDWNEVGKRLRTMVETITPALHHAA